MSEAKEVNVSGLPILTFALVELNEGPFGAATMQVARADTMAARGVVNTGGNLGGVILYPTLGYSSGRGDWTQAFAVGTITCLASGTLWLMVRADQRFTPTRPASAPELPRTPP